ncbi:hypothetical protein AOT31_00005 [Corynebacterium ulcerans]|nr:hypothetical protein AOT31_00005 [Corynebacterium ulcerans]
MNVDNFSHTPVWEVIQVVENSVEYAVTAPKRCEQLGEIPVNSEITFFTAGWGNLVALDIIFGVSERC